MNVRRCVYVLIVHRYVLYLWIWTWRMFVVYWLGMMKYVWVFYFISCSLCTKLNVILLDSSFFGLVIFDFLLKLVFQRDRWNKLLKFRTGALMTMNATNSNIPDMIITRIFMSVILLHMVFKIYVILGSWYYVYGSVVCLNAFSKS